MSSQTTGQSEIQALEMQLYELTNKLNELRRNQSKSSLEVPDYSFATTEGETSLSALFGQNERLLVVHNMGQACRYCTLWADGFNGFLPHLESEISVVLVSKDDPQTQRRFANSRGWRFRLASHGGGDYIREQSAMPGQNNMPGAVTYERREGKIYRRDSAVFGPGDLYCSAWNLMGLAGLTETDWMPQYNYWQRPEKLDDGGERILD